LLVRAIRTSTTNIFKAKTGHDWTTRTNSLLLCKLSTWGAINRHTRNIHIHLARCLDHELVLSFSEAWSSLGGICLYTDRGVVQAINTDIKHIHACNRRQVAWGQITVFNFAEKVGGYVISLVRKKCDIHVSLANICQGIRVGDRNIAVLKFVVRRRRKIVARRIGAVCNAVDFNLEKEDN
jgi:hypothetical protein